MWADCGRLWIVWYNNRSKLVELMEKCKAERLTRNRRSLLRKRTEMVAALVGKFAIENQIQFFPGVADICLISQELRKLILASDPTVAVDESSFSEWLLKLPELCRTWRRTQDTFLLKLLPLSTSESHPTGGDSDVSRLQLATTYFNCQTCQCTILYPRILAHSCMTAQMKIDADSNLKELWGAMRRMPWNYTGDKVRLHKEAYDAAHQIVLTCGKDPAATTASEMDELDVRVECVSCSRHRFAMTWRAGVSILFSALTANKD
jgi:hypothetical protein